jgi:hypothetical protein
LIILIYIFNVQFYNFSQWSFSFFLFEFEANIFVSFGPHCKLNPGSIYLWYFDPGFNFPYGILTPGSIFLSLYFEPPPHFYQKRGVHNTYNIGRRVDIPWAGGSKYHWSKYHMTPGQFHYAMITVLLIHITMDL